MSTTLPEKTKLQKQMEDFYIPEHCRDTLERYILEHIPTGSFLQNLLSNNLKETFASTDVINRLAIVNYVEFLYNCVPSACWGSPERYNNWINARK